MNILTTGGAGFIGSHMAERLVTDGHHVVVVDNEATGRAENVPSGAHYVRGDVTDQACLEDIFASGLDAVFHVAGQVSLIRSFTDPQVDPPHEYRRNGQCASTLRQISRTAAPLRQLDDGLRLHRRPPDPGRDPVPASVLLRHHEIRGPSAMCTRRPSEWTWTSSSA